MTCLLENARDGLWVGTDGGGLTLLKGGQARRYTDREGLSSNYVTSLHEDGEGALWIGTYSGGLALFKNGRFASVGTRNGLFENVVWVTLEDDAGNIWMSGNRGIFRASKKELEETAAGLRGAVRCESFGRSDGLGSEECNGGTQSPAARTRSGLLCFGTLKGLAVLDPLRLPKNQVVPPVRIESLFLDGRPATLERPSVLAPGRHRLEFRFTALSLVAPDKNRFRYQLSGFDAEWVEAGKKRDAVYTIQQPGPYRFRVIGSNNDGVWNEEGASHSFRLKPHFYETPLFYSACALAALLAGWGGYSSRVRSLKARQEQLESLVAERTMDLAVEKEKSEELLLSILPAYIAERKKAGEGTIADHYEDVAILFADIVDFTPLSILLPPENVVYVLDSVFSEFDRLTELHGLEKIKTIGDCYMVVAGIPEPRPDATRAVADMGLDMLSSLEKLGDEIGIPLKLRIGINAGEAVAGVIGRKKFTYDLWSDAVNTASRMESHGEPGRIQCTEEVHRRLSGLYEFEDRGEVFIKGKGMMRTFNLLRRKAGTRGTL